MLFKKLFLYLILSARKEHRILKRTPYFLFYLILFATHIVTKIKAKKLEK